ncbi:MAG: hypothetical protein D6692_02520 [Planctomycetota bacterium]|nr:MAG: hypothetical protein D6692_02520 [Planctomycetota bacterium]
MALRRRQRLPRRHPGLAPRRRAHRQSHDHPRPRRHDPGPLPHPRHLHPRRRPRPRPHPHPHPRSRHLPLLIPNPSLRSLRDLCDLCVQNLNRMYRICAQLRVHARESP